ncbi:MAG: glycosyltransferase, partial [Candidatus Methylomirabilales bacterium]
PIREELLTGDRERARKTLGLMAGRMTVLILGGSQGAHRLNEALIDALPRLGALRGKVQFLHATGTRDLEAVQRAYAAWGGCARAAAFFEEMASVYAATDLAVCRAGATTIAELAALGKPAVLVPYPHAANDHQRWNAAVLVEAGGAEMIGDQDLSGEGLAEAIGTVMGQSERLQVMGAKARSLGRPDAAQSIADLLIALTERRRG